MLPIQKTPTAPRPRKTEVLKQQQFEEAHPRKASEKVVDVDHEEEKTSRHNSVMIFQIYQDWDGPLLDDTRKAFQSLIIVRDEIFIKKHSGHSMFNFKLVLLEALNFKLVLLEEQKIMNTRD
jgi:hypothetical protein